MTLLTPTTTPEYRERVEGTWGEFSTGSGRISYVMTTARLGSSGTDLEHRLTRQLRPVREVLGIANLDFDQLLQRDLDDHRVATELVPYLLRSAPTGPAFFPPILAVLLPFDNSSPSHYPDRSDPVVVNENDMPFREVRYGAAFRSRRFWNTDSGTAASIRYGTLSWNDELAKVVVLDGQHRAMALLAIDRTINNGWEDAGRGARYRYFYEERVRKALEEAGNPELEDLQIPVTVCWMPDMAGPQQEPHLAARKLFVDVNRSAKPPSTDRVALLSDTDLVSILTRALLNEMRDGAAVLALEAIEYDNPTRRSGPPTRWSAMSSLQALQGMVERVIFGPRKYVESVDTPMRGRPNEIDVDPFMREQLRFPSILEQRIPDDRGFVAREEVKRREFPRQALPAITAEFMHGWGRALLVLLSEVAPYRAHLESLRRLEHEWQPADAGAIDALAREAVFDGVGMYWILLNSFRHWKYEGGHDEASAPDIVKAWTRLIAKRAEFRNLRAEVYLGERVDAQGLTEVESMYSVATTHACQAGLALTLATICSKMTVTGSDVEIVASSVAAALNDALAGACEAGPSRRLCLGQRVPDPVNRIADMNPSRAVEFRYLWLELLCTEEGTSRLAQAEPALDLELLHELRDLARTRYAEQLVDERVRERRRFERDLSREQLQFRVTVEVTSSLQSSLSSWFGVTREDFEEWASEAEFALGDDELDGSELDADQLDTDL